MVSRREGTGGVTASHSHEPQGDEPGHRVDGQQLARVEHESFGSAGELEEVGHPALLAPTWMASPSCTLVEVISTGESTAPLSAEQARPPGLAQGADPCLWRLSFPWAGP